MKLIYISPDNLSNKSGTTIKMIGQMGAMKRAGMNVEPIYPSDGKIMFRGDQVGHYSIIPYYGFFDMLKKLYQAALEIAEMGDITNFYIRFSIFDWSFYNFVKKVKQKGCHVFLEIPSYPYEQEYDKKNIIKKNALLIDRIFRHGITKYIDAIFTPSEFSENTIFNIPAFRFGNGIDPESITPRKTHISPQKTLRLIGVAKLSSWHGYDRVISGISEYYQKGGNYDVIFNLVGYGPEFKKLKELTLRLNLEKRVIFHGHKFGKELDKIYEESDVGVDAIGVHRKGLRKISSLKSREYCLKSIPFITVENIDDDFTDNKYCIKVKPDDTQISIDFVVEKYKEFQSSNYLLEMRNYGERYLCWDYQFQGVINNMEQISNNSLRTNSKE